MRVPHIVILTLCKTDTKIFAMAGTEKEQVSLPLVCKGLHISAPRREQGDVMPRTTRRIRQSLEISRPAKAQERRLRLRRKRRRIACPPIRPRMAVRAAITQWLQASNRPRISRPCRRRGASGRVLHDDPACHVHKRSKRLSFGLLECAAARRQGLTHVPIQAPAVIEVH